MKILEAPNESPLTLRSIFLITENSVVRFLRPDVEIQMLIGAVPSYPTAPVAINFLPPEAGENACQKWLIQKNRRSVMDSCYHGFYISSVCVTSSATEYQPKTVHTIVVQLLPGAECLAINNVCLSRETADDKRVIIIDVR